MEFAGEGDLKSLIQHRKNCNAPFSEKEIWSAASHLLSALHDLHRLGVVHRDLKPANVFVSGGVFKVGDFNVSKVLREEMAVTQTGTPYYASPEIWRDRPY
jgi:NIMA (never in mitosis gene a)-related kinase 1/4/5